MQKGVKILFRVSKTDWHDHEIEAIWAEPVGQSQYRLANPPFCAYEYSLGDVVEAKPDPKGELFAQRVVSRGGHSTYRVMIPKAGMAGYDSFRSRLEALGCTTERASDAFAAIDVPPAADIDSVYAILEEGEADGVWTFQESHYGRARP